MKDKIKSEEKPDISVQKTFFPAPIKLVGLQGIQLPLQVQWGDEVQKIIAKVHIFVSLDEPALRGIHMSRLYLSLHEFSKNQILNLSTLNDLLDNCISSQKGISSNGRIRISWKGFLQKKALQSPHKGWHVYPCFYEVIQSKGLKKISAGNPNGLKKTSKNGISSLENEVVSVNNSPSYSEKFLGGKILYSSTCPCSAALSRNLMQNKFKEDGKNFSYSETIRWLGKESSFVGTPHSQRSEARFKVKVIKDISLPALIQGMEKALATPVQVAVKREDEQEFARLNSQNLMYSEDAVRKIKNYLETQKDIINYQVKVRHIESLHPFDTIAMVTKS